MVTDILFETDIYLGQASPLKGRFGHYEISVLNSAYNCSKLINNSHLSHDVDKLGVQVSQYDIPYSNKGLQIRTNNHTVFYIYSIAPLDISFRVIN